MKPLNEEAKRIYDRQIRLFGLDTQQKIKNEKINLFTASDVLYLPGEILKNFALLGIERMTMDENSKKSLNNILPNDLKDINEEIVFEIKQFDKEFKMEEIYIFIDFELFDIKNTKSFFICSRCFNFQRGYIEHECKSSVKGNRVVFECLLGSIFTQEILKMIKGDAFLDSFKLEL